jgi:hypothetical protein
MNPNIASSRPNAKASVLQNRSFRQKVKQTGRHHNTAFLLLTVPPPCRSPSAAAMIRKREKQEEAKAAIRYTTGPI